MKVVAVYGVKDGKMIPIFGPSEDVEKAKEIWNDITSNGKKYKTSGKNGKTIELDGITLGDVDRGRMRRR